MYKLTCLTDLYVTKDDNDIQVFVYQTKNKQLILSNPEFQFKTAMAKLARKCVFKMESRVPTCIMLYACKRPCCLAGTLQHCFLSGARERIYILATDICHLLWKTPERTRVRKNPYIVMEKKNLIFVCV